MINYFGEEDYTPQWTDQGSLLNPVWIYNLSHGEAIRENDTPQLNDMLLFGLTSSKIEGVWYAGYYYNPIPHFEKEDVAHYFPINKSFQPHFNTEDEALVWAIKRFFEMYDNINFQFKVFIYKNLLQYAISKEWILIVDNVALSDVLSDKYANILYQAKLLFTRREMELEQKEKELEEKTKELEKAKRTLRSFY